jgi:ribosomal protein S18 acetylase RimI-like enzyme
VIIGGMFYRSKRAKCGYMKYPLREWKEWLCFKMNDSFSIYIMTIGVANEFRGLGIAKSFLQSIKCIIIYAN